jgi:formylglycine-generating enzyme required for sulfatase activity
MLQALLFCLALTAAAFVPAAAADGTSVRLAAGAVLQDCADCPQMVVVPAGGFTMGFDGGEQGRPEGPRREISLARPFALGRFEITHAQYAAFVAATGHDSGPGCYGPLKAGDTGAWTWYEAATWRDPSGGSGQRPAAEEPAVCVSWSDAQAYVAWLSRRTGQRYRLPTEAEWEYAARAGSTTEFPWGDDADAGCAWANVYDASTRDASRRSAPANCRDRHAGVAPVGAYPANAFGLHDLIGNVWEWTQDCYRVPYPATPVDGTAVEVQGPCELRTVRGGSWRSHMFRQRSTWRGRDPEDRKSDIFGFRIARDLP